MWCCFANRNIFGYQNDSGKDAFLDETFIMSCSIVSSVDIYTLIASATITLHGVINTINLNTSIMLLSQELPKLKPMLVIILTIIITKCIHNCF